MLCEVCASIGRVRLGEAQQRPARHATDGAGPACEACGSTLGTVAGGLVARTIDQLARFGLVGQNRLFRGRA